MFYPVSGVRDFVTGLNHPECVAVGRDGTLYAGGKAGQIYRISQNGQKVESIASTSGFCLESLSINPITSMSATLRNVLSFGFARVVV